MAHMTYDFSGGNYIVTGASSGIGKEVALALAGAGAKILAIARDEERLEEVRSRHADLITTVSVDVREADAYQTAVARYVECGRISGTVHAAGVNFFMPLRAYTREKANVIMDTSFWAAMELLKISTKKAYSMDGASHVMLTSVAANIGQPGFVVYGAAKNAMISACKTLSLEVAKRKLRINTVSPGWIPTQVAIEIEKQIGQSIEETEKEYPLGIGRIDDVVNSVLFLLSNQSRWITGTNLIVDGGYSAGK